MGKFLFVVFTTPKDGEDDAYNEWYDNQHIKDLLAIEGVKSATRYDLAPTDPPQPSSPYLALYEVEADSVAEIGANLARAREEGRMPTSSAMDSSKTITAFYVPHVPS